jgi:Septum formation
VRRPVLVLMVLCALLAGCATSGPVGLPTTADAVGTCKLLQTAEEMVALSDVSPAVSCGSPHVYETYAVTRVPADLARAAERPGADRITGHVACPYKPIRPYLGAGPLDNQWGIDVWSKVPTRTEWSHGVRTLVCDLVVAAERPDTVPLVDFPLHEVMHFTDSARVRLCRTGSSTASYLTCDRPHIGEKMGTVTLSPKLHGRALTSAGDRACHAEVQQYTGQSSLAGFEAEWDATVQTTGNCWLTSTRGPVSGTRRGGLVSR